MLVTICRPKTMNSIPHSLHWQFDRMFKWFDEESALRVAIITGQGPKAFCAGSDLLEIESVQKHKLASPNDDKPWEHSHPPTGFAGVSRRNGKKPILAAVNGLALGGGFEIVLGWYV
jgi:enoyl-CoA hydratase/carnithine racemase